MFRMLSVHREKYVLHGPSSHSLMHGLHSTGKTSSHNHIFSTKENKLLPFAPRKTKWASAFHLHCRTIRTCTHSASSRDQNIESTATEAATLHEGAQRMPNGWRNSVEQVERGGRWEVGEASEHQA